MKKRLLLPVLSLAVLSSAFLWQDSDAPFGGRQAHGKINNPEINEASGLKASVVNPGRLWVHNDSGDKARFFLLDDSAKCLATYYLQDVEARDWEDMGTMRRGGKTYLLLGDIGDNGAQRRSITVHVVEEPVARHVSAAYTDTIRHLDIRTYVLKYEDGARDAEALFYDELDQKLYIISKRDLQAGLYGADLPEQPLDTLILRKKAVMPHTIVTAADLSADGQELLVKNYQAVYYWKRLPGEGLPHMFQRPATQLPYQQEPQGEAITFVQDGSGYYTTSEKKIGMDPVLYWYPRVQQKK